MNLSIPGMCRRRPLNMGYELATGMLLRMQRGWPKSLLLHLLGNTLQRNGLPVFLQVRLLPLSPAFLPWEHGGQILFQPMQIMILFVCFSVQVFLSGPSAVLLPLPLSFPMRHSFLVPPDLDLVIHVYASLLNNQHKAGKSTC